MHTTGAYRFYYILQGLQSHAIKLKKSLSLHDLVSLFSAKGRECSTSDWKCKEKYFRHLADITTNFLLQPIFSSIFQVSRKISLRIICQKAVAPLVCFMVRGKTRKSILKIYLSFCRINQSRDKV